MSSWDTQALVLKAGHCKQATPSMPNSFLGNVWLLWGLWGLQGLVLYEMIRSIPVWKTGRSTWIPKMKPAEVRKRSLLFCGQHQPQPTKMIKTWVQSSIEFLHVKHFLQPIRINSTRQHLTHPIPKPSTSINFQESPTQLPTQHSQGSCTAAPPRNIDSGLARP